MSRRAPERRRASARCAERDACISHACEARVAIDDDGASCTLTCSRCVRGWHLPARPPRTSPLLSRPAGPRRMEQQSSTAARENSSSTIGWLSATWWWLTTTASVPAPPNRYWHTVCNACRTFAYNGCSARLSLLLSGVGIAAGGATRISRHGTTCRQPLRHVAAPAKLLVWRSDAWWLERHERNCVCAVDLHCVALVSERHSIDRIE